MATADSSGAASLAWDGSNTTLAGAQGGAGTWNSATTANWWNGSADVTWPGTGTDNDAVFGGTAGTVALASGVTVNDITFTTSGYTLSGANTLTINGTTPTVTVGSGISATIGNNTATVLAGSSGLNLSGLGSLTLNSSAVSTLTGGLTLGGGSTLTLNFGNLGTPTNLINSGNALTLKGGNLNILGKATGTTSQTVSGTNVLSGNSAISVGNNGGTSATLALGSISQGEIGGVVVIQNSSGSPTATTVNIATASNTINAYIGPWAVVGNNKSGLVRWAYVNATGQVVTISGTSASNQGTLTSDTTVYTISGSSTFDANRKAYAVQQNGGTGAYTLGAFTFTTNGIAPLTAATNLSFTGATGGGGIVVGTPNELVLTALGTTTVSVPIMNGTAGNSHVTYAGGGSLVIDTVASTYSGQTTVNSGTVRIGSGGSINSSSGIKVNGGVFSQTNTTTAVTPTVTLQGGGVDGTGTINTVNVSSLATNVVSHGSGTSGTLTIGNLTFNGQATANFNPGGTAGVNVTGTLTTTPANGKIAVNVPTAQAWVNGNTYNLIGYGSFSGSASDFTVGAVAGLSARQVATLATTGASNGFLTLQIAGDNVVWTGGTNAKWTTTAIGSPYNWQLQAGATGTEFLANDAVVFDDSATGSTDIVISDANVSPLSTTFNNSSKNYTVSTSSSFGIATGSLTKNGSGTVLINTINTYTGATTINAGTLQLSGGGNIADTGLVTLANTAGATFEIFSDETIGALNGGGATGGAVLIDAGATLSLSSGTRTFAGTVSGFGGINNAGAFETLSGVVSTNSGVTVSSGVLTLTNPGNNYFGTTNVTQSACLLVSANGALGMTGPGNITNVAGAVGFSGGVNYTTNEKISGAGLGNTSTNAAFPAVQRGFIQSVSGSNTFGGTVEINATGTTRIGMQDGAPFTVSAPITMATGVTGVQILIRSGDLDGDFVTLSNPANSWDANTFVYSGNNNAAQFAGLRLGANNALPTASSIAGRSDASAATTFDMAGFNQTVNGLTENSGPLKIVNLTPATSSVLTLSNTLDRSVTQTSILDGAGQISIVKTGSFMQTLSATDNYSGTTSIQGGTLLFGKEVSLYNGNTANWTPSKITVESGAVLGLTVGATGTFTSADVALIDTALTTGIGNNGLKAGSFLNLNVTAVTTVSATLTDSTGTGGGAVGLIKTGVNTLTLDHTSTYTGETMVAAGALALGIPSAIQNTPVITLATGTTLVTTSINWTLGGTQTLKGTGSVSGSTTLAGTVSPGTSTANVGTLALGATSGSTALTGTYACDVTATGSDKLTVTGGLDLTGSTLTVNAVSPTGSYTIATYTGTLTSTFAHVTVPSGYAVDYGTAGQIKLIPSTGSPYDTWMSGYPSITDPAQKLPTADPDGDGVNNQTEFAFGLAPNNGASSNPILVPLSKTGTFTYQRRKPSLSALTYKVMISTDLATWSQDTTATQVATDIPSTDNQSVVVTLTGAPLTAPKMFVRVLAQ